VEPHDTPQPELSRPGNPGHDEMVSGYTCPECNGTLWEVREGNLVKLRCRVGHSYTEASYAAAKSEALEAALWTALQTLEEKADFARRLAARFDPSQPLAARRYEDQRANLLEQAARVRSALEDIETGELDPAELEAS
jgi:two-component system chemotaxis response regulator CheB